MNNLLSKINLEVLSCIRKIINNYNINPNINIDLKVKDDWESIKVKLGLPDDPVRSINEKYTPPPVRYIITSVEIATVLAKEQKPIDVINMNFRSHGYLGKYEIYSEIMFPSDKLVVLEDNKDEIKVLISAQCRLRF